jgi:hypothetical protein
MQNMTDCSECKGMYEAASSFYAQEEDRLCNPCITKWAESRPCPDCAGGPISTKRTDESLWFRSGEDRVELKCNVPVRHCAACKFEFLDYEVEQIHLATTNAYLVSIGEKPQER